MYMYVCVRLRATMVTNNMTLEKDPNQSVYLPNRKDSSQCPSVAAARRR